MPESGSSNSDPGCVKTLRVLFLSGLTGGWHGTLRCLGTDRDQATLFPPCLEDWIAEDNPVRVIDVFVDALDLGSLGFEGVEATATGRPGYHPSALLKLYVYGYLNRILSSRRLEREAGRNVEVMWLTARLSLDHKTIA